LVSVERADGTFGLNEHAITLVDEVSLVYPLETFVNDFFSVNILRSLLVFTHLSNSYPDSSQIPSSFPDVDLGLAYTTLLGDGLRNA